MTALNYIVSAAVSALVACAVTFYFMPRMIGGLAATWREPAAHPVAVAPVEPTVAAAREPVEKATDADVERLTRENAELSAQLAEARARLAAEEGTLKRTQAQLEDLRRPMVADVLSSTLRAELKSGEVVVTGGYRLPDGRRLYAFAKPAVEEADGAKVVTIEGRYITLTDEVGKTVGLDNLATNAANTLQHGEVWVSGEEADVMSRLANTAGTDVVSYPGIVVTPGESGTISVGDIQLRVTPELAEKGGSVGMELRLEQPQRPADAVP